MTNECLLLIFVSVFMGFDKSEPSLYYFLFNLLIINLRFTSHIVEMRLFVSLRWNPTNASRFMPKVQNYKFAVVRDSIFLPALI